MKISNTVFQFVEFKNLALGEVFFSDGFALRMETILDEDCVNEIYNAVSFEGVPFWVEPDYKVGRVYGEFVPALGVKVD